MLKKITCHPFFIFPLVTLFVFWPISFHFFTLKNDALTYYYPVRTLISDALHNGQLPLWTPYLNMGYPLHADLQSGAWNPVIWIFSFLTNYSLAGFHLEFLFYICFAGIGFYYLLKNFGLGKTAAIIGALAYQFSGFIVDSVQFFNCISAACYVPFIFLFFRKMLLHTRKKDAMLTALFLYLLFTGGYPSFFITIAYILAAYAICMFWVNKDKKALVKKLIVPATITLSCFLLLSLPAVISFVPHLSFIDRGKDQSLATVLENSMNPTTMLSLISPLSTTAKDNWLQSEILMRNIYIGLVPLIFLVFACFKKELRTKHFYFFFTIALLSLLMAFGEFFYLRQLAYYILPLMKSFRHPALFRSFSIFFWLIIMAHAIDHWLKKRSADDFFLKKITIIFFSAVVILFIICLIDLKRLPLPSSFNVAGFKDFLLTSNFTERLLLQLPVVIMILLFFLFFLSKAKKTWWLIAIVFADLFITAQLNIPVTVVGSQKFAVVEQQLDRNMEYFPLPGRQSIEENSLNSEGPDLPSRSTLMFTKKIGRNDYFITPGNLRSQQQFYYSPIRPEVFKNPVLYFENNGRPLPGDSIIITDFSGNKMEATVNCQQPNTLIYLQNNYPGWQAFVDEKKADIQTINMTFMSIQVPAGKHTIVFSYRPNIVITAHYISLITMIAILVTLIISFSKSRSAIHQTEKE